MVLICLNDSLKEIPSRYYCKDIKIGILEQCFRFLFALKVSLISLYIQAGVSEKSPIPPPLCADLPCQYAMGNSMVSEASSHSSMVK